MPIHEVIYMCIKASFYIPENTLHFPTTKVYKTVISIKLVYKYMAIFINFLTTLNHLHPLQVENCDSNSRLVVDEYDNGKSGLNRLTETTPVITDIYGVVVNFIELYFYLWMLIKPVAC